MRRSLARHLSSIAVVSVQVNKKPDFVVPAESSLANPIALVVVAVRWLND